MASNTNRNSRLPDDLDDEVRKFLVAMKTRVDLVTGNFGEDGKTPTPEFVLKLVEGILPAIYVEGTTSGALNEGDTQTIDGKTIDGRSIRLSRALADNTNFGAHLNANGTYTVIWSKKCDVPGSP